MQCIRHCRRERLSCESSPHFSTSRLAHQAPSSLPPLLSLPSIPLLPSSTSPVPNSSSPLLTPYPTPPPLPAISNLGTHESECTRGPSRLPCPPLPPFPEHPPPSPSLAHLGTHVNYTFQSETGANGGLHERAASTQGDCEWQHTAKQANAALQPSARFPTVCPS